MENAANALKMAAAILIFIIAIGASFSLFGTAKQTADSIITMRDKQTYLAAAELESVVYTSSDKIKTYEGFTSNGDRIVNVDDVFSSIYRYAIENYSVTIIEGNNVIARYDTTLESYIGNYNTYGEAFFREYQRKIEKNIKTDYCLEPQFTNKIEDLYLINGKYNIPWLGNMEDIKKRINLDISGQSSPINGISYQGKNLLNKLEGGTIVEVTNEVDQSKYLKDEGEETSLVQQYNIPTVEIVYIILN